MTTVKSLLKYTRLIIPKCQQSRALGIERSLYEGAPYTSIGGQRVHSQPELIRFRLGTHWRLLFLYTKEGFEAYRLITRQSFDVELRRRR